MGKRPKNLRLLLALLGLVTVVALASALAIDRAMSRPTLVNSEHVAGLATSASAYLEDLERKYGKKQYSYLMEETLIRDVFDDASDGYFVDVGASHYEKLSNTYYLEKNLGWRGIGIDAQDKYAADYARYRPHTKYLLFFVGDPASSGKQIEFFVDLENEYLSSGVDGAVTHASKKILVPSITLDELLAREGVTKVDFLSMDIEDGEPPALAGFSIQRFQPRLVCIEMHAAVRKAISEYFERNGYVRLVSYGAIDWLNGYFVRAGSPDARREEERMRAWLERANAEADKKRP